MSAKRGPKMQQPDHETVYQFVCRHSRPFVESAEVVDEFKDVSGVTIRDRLHDLADDGRIERKRVGNALVWYVSE